MDPAATSRAPVSGALAGQDEVERALASWRATGLTDDDTADLARAATARVALAVGAPVTPHAATDRYPRWDGRLALSARRLDGAAFDAATLTNIAVGATADGADEALDPALWLPDLTAPAPAVLVRDAPPTPADDLEELPVWVSYHYDPLGTSAASDTAALVAHCVVLAMREEFALRTQGAGAPPTGAARHIDELLAPLRRLPV